MVWPINTVDKHMEQIVEKVNALMSVWRLGGQPALAAEGIYVPPKHILETLVNTSLGAASVCWEEAALLQAGVFLSDKAIKVGVELVDALIMQMIGAQLLRK